jgi:SAM-dependent methyltransferase
MDVANAAQIADWNGEQGRRWAQLQQHTDAMIAPFGRAALQAAAPQPGERVLDIGCGCGTETLALARAVMPGGQVLGVDVSAPMLEVARQLAAGAPELPLRFAEADAATAALPPSQDLLYSRFGLMFFDRPAAALRHLRGALRPGGRIVFICWRAPRDNPWAMAPLVAARKALGITPPPADPLAPGPFAFADEPRLRGLLEQAGYQAIDIRRVDALLHIGSDADDAAAQSLRIGPAARLARDAGPAHEPLVRQAVTQALAALAAADGSVHLAGSVWLVTASTA